MPDTYLPYWHRIQDRSWKKDDELVSLSLYWDVQPDVDQSIRDLPIVVELAAWYWTGQVWFDKAAQLYCNDVWVDGFYEQTLTAESLEDLIFKSTCVYGEE